MFSLPKITGLFPVGATTFVTPVRPSLTIGSIKRVSHQPEPGLQLEEVAYTAYYPTNTSPGTGNVPFHWVVRPIRESLRGFISFTGLPGWVLWPIIYIFGAFITVPVKANAPLLSPRQPHASGPVPEQWPLVIFSHGLGGSRTAYSQLCSRIAASGKVVLAIEHRDGTAHASLPRTWGVGGKSEPKPVLYLRESDHLQLTCSHDQNGPGIYPLLLRTDQLTFRRHEIYIAFDSFSRLVRGDPTLELDTIDDSPFDRARWFPLDHHSRVPPVKLTDVSLTGHSFGGCTVLSMLSSQPLYGRLIPIAKALILDPWLEPIPSPGPTPLPPGPSPREKTQKLPRMLVINSETFTLWKDHFARLRDVVLSWEPEEKRILTLVGSQHHSFSDAQVLPLIRRKSSEMLLEVIARLSVAFLDGRLDSLLEETPTIPMRVEIIGKRKDGRPKRKLVGNVGDIVVS
ncbi:platelet-activating factor acetylhydrolase [Infundibulicybe gibba]|nr:platelet-activating factor acetylhydrolase [Infundibulicybe gibba]